MAKQYVYSALTSNRNIRLPDVSPGKLGEAIIEYWDTTTEGWIKSKPAVDTIRIPGVVHEASTAFAGAKKRGGSLDNWYRPHGVRNVT